MPSIKELQKQAEGDLALVKDIDEKLSAMGGTISARIKAAREAVLPTVTIKADELFGTPEGETFTLAEAEDIAQAVAEAVKQAVDEAVAGHLKASKDETKETAEALKSQRAEAIDRLKAFATIGLIDSSQVPKSGPKVRTSGTSTGGGKVKVSNIRYYRVKDGERTDQKDSQNSFSSLAWYYSKNENGDRMSAGDLATLVKNETGKDPYAEAFEFDMGNGYVIGAEVVAQADEA